MSDPALAIEILTQILSAVERILVRFTPVDSVSFFLDSEEIQGQGSPSSPDRVRGRTNEESARRAHHPDSRELCLES